MSLLQCYFTFSSIIISLAYRYSLFLLYLFTSLLTECFSCLFLIHFSSMLFLLWPHLTKSRSMKLDFCTESFHCNDSPLATGGCIHVVGFWDLLLQQRSRFMPFAQSCAILLRALPSRLLGTSNDGDCRTSLDNLLPCLLLSLWVCTSCDAT